MNDSVGNLVRCAVGGDKDALGELLLRFGPDVERGLFISATWRGMVDAADVMQITYIEAFGQISRFDPARPEAFGAWLRRIAENNLRDAIRSLEARKNPPPRMQLDAYGGDSCAALFDVLTAGTGTPSQAVRRNEAGTRLREALRLLPPDYARAVQLYDLDLRSIDEVAAELNRSHGAIYMLRSRGFERLRELLGSPSHYFESRS
ncbi:MAG: sigma-70 family RNA polymerase sigma factor [Planctomycetia bacterium]|nr:MAG: sigma-70 family RNA polymerase sigma factor [Planctomycetia bacterium]